jgi:hypothetical protein
MEKQRRYRDSGDSRGYVPHVSVNRRRPRNGRVSAMGQDPVQVRYLNTIDDSDMGNYPTVIIRPMASRFLLNRMGGAHLDVVAAATKTPYPHADSINANRSWIPARPLSTPQYHRLGGTAPHSMRRSDVVEATNKAATMNEVRARLANLFGGF